MLTTYVALDFDGHTSAEARHAFDELHHPSGWKVENLAQRSFVDEFAAIGDPELMIDQIMERVSEDFAPYGVSVVRMDDHQSATDLIETNPGHDTYVWVGIATVFNGQAATDPENRRDSLTYASAAPGDLADTDEFANAMANLISHEVGHTFGLEHIDPDFNSYDAGDYGYGASLMTTSFGKANEGFADINYKVDDDKPGKANGREQNEHQYLTRVLGESEQPWAAVLTPGVLTIGGSNFNDTASVFGTFEDDWVVSLAWQDSRGAWQSSHHHVDPHADSDWNSLNHLAYDSPITTIRFDGNDGNDVFGVDGIGGRTIDFTTRIVAHGGKGNDELTGGVGDDQLWGDDGNDTLKGGDGHDRMDGNAGDDRMWGGRGSDRVYGHDGRDLIFGEAGNDTLRGYDGDDRISGGEGHDTMLGGDGHDRMDGNAGDDRMWGGRGDDRVFGHDGRDLIFGEAGNDTLRGYDGDDRISGGDGHDTMLGGDGHDRMDGNAGDDRMWGGRGHDRVYGQDGRDSIFGEAGNDTLRGYDGDDLLSGGKGKDHMSGGSGNDTICDEEQGIGVCRFET